MILQEIKTILDEARYVLVLTHINPDADTISCGLALSNYMYENKIKHKVYNRSRDIPKILDFLPKFDKITDQIPKFYDLVISVDSANIDRLSFDIPNEVKVINIDHHASNSFFGDINIVDDSKASTAELLYELFVYNDMKISKNTAQCIYTGIYDDSIGFTTPRVDSKTFQAVQNLLETGIDPSYIADNLLRRDSLARFRMMPKILDSLNLYFEGKVAFVHMEQQWLNETGAKVHECDDIANMVLSLAVVDMIAYLRVVDGKTRISLRSKKDIDVSKIASNFNGGGHKNAAGLTIDTLNMDDAKEQLLKAIQNYI